MLEAFKYPFYVIFHPFDGFYDMKHENRGRVYVAIASLFFFWVSYSINRQYAGFVVNEINPINLNTIIDLIAVLSLFLLFAVGNWSITCLMEGEGRFKDIVMATAYAMTPMNLLFIPATFVGNYVAQNEEAFYFMMLGLGVTWFLLLMFVGIMTVHNYSLLKTIVTFFLTMLAMLVIIFLILLMTTLIQQVFLFIRSIYTELIFRA